MRYVHVKRQGAPAEREKAEQQDTEAGEPHATLPPRWCKNASDTTHHQHCREGTQPERRHGQESWERLAGARGFGGKCIDQWTRQEAVEYSQSERGCMVARRH